MNKQYPKGEGAMFANQKQNEKQPDWRGNIEVTSAQLRELLDMAKANQANPVPDFKLKMQVASWNRIAKNTGAEYMYLSTEVYNPEVAPAPTPPPAPPAPAPEQFEDIPF
jgi:uncharacterized protein (DUF736 family)|tara:strand:+ start:272 stop:601 length:330 start_codon:yes stop_codon:yes gene_type:complete